MKFQLPNNQELYYEIHGNAKAEITLLFLGGLSQSTLAWQAYLPSFSADYQIILLDLMFQGQSDNPATYKNFQEHAQDAHSLLAHLNVQKVIPIGISYGGAVALRLMRYHPERIVKSVLMATFAHKTAMFDAIGTAWQRALEIGGYPLMLDVMLPFVLGKHYFQNPLIPIEILRQMRTSQDLSVERLNKLMLATAVSTDFRPELAHIQIPTLVICGDEDILCTPEFSEEIARKLPHSTYKEIKNAGHTLNLEAIPQSIALIKQFTSDAI